MHVHNTFPLLSPDLPLAIKSATATVLTLHNYRTVCAAAIPMREGQPAPNASTSGASPRPYAMAATGTAAWRLFLWPR